LGVTTAALTGAVRVAASGDFAVNLAKLNLPQRQISIRMHQDKATRQDLDAIAQLLVPGKAGPVPLSAVADLTLGGGSAQINRVGRRRTVNIDVELGGRLIGAVIAEADALPSLANPPPGLERVPAGRRPAHG
jgi:multidrug efflux pump subunit AcrB